MAVGFPTGADLEEIQDELDAQGLLSPWIKVNPDRIEYNGVHVDGNPTDQSGLGFTNTTGLDVTNTQIGTTGTAFWFARRARGTPENLQPLLNGDSVGWYAFGSYNGTVYQTTSGIRGSNVIEGGSYAGVLNFDIKRPSDVNPTTAGFFDENHNYHMTAYPDTRLDAEKTLKALVGTGTNGEVLQREIWLMDCNEVSGRVYGYGDDRWISEGDDNFGTNIENWNESGGTGADPNYEWEHQGKMVSKGDWLRTLILSGTSNSTAFQEMEVLVAFRTPNQVGAYGAAGVDNDAEMSNTEIFRENFFNPVDASKWGPAFSGNTNDMHRRKVSLNFVCPEDGWISIYYKPTITGTTTRYYRVSRKLEILLGDSYA